MWARIGIFIPSEPHSPLDTCCFILCVFFYFFLVMNRLLHVLIDIVRWPRYKSGQNCANYIYKQTSIFMLQHVKCRKILDIDTFAFLHNKRKICSNQRRLFSVDLGYHWAINCSDYEVNTSVV